MRSKPWGWEVGSFQSATLPSREELLASVLDIEAALTEDAIIGRQRLHGLFRDRRIDLSPVAGVYVLRRQVRAAENNTGDPQ